MARKSTPKVNGLDTRFAALTPEGQHFVLAAFKLAESERSEAAEPASAPKPASKRKPKADAPKDSVFVKGCTFTYVKKDSSESQHRIVRTEGDSVIARALASGQERPWKRTTLAAMLQTGNVIVKS